MANPRYTAGRAFEYKTKAHWEGLGYTVIRSAGSHGPFDLVAIPIKSHLKVVGIQCKRVQTLAEANRLTAQWPTFPSTAPIIQCLTIYVVSTRETINKYA